MTKYLLGLDFALWGVWFTYWLFYRLAGGATMRTFNSMKPRTAGRYGHG